MTPEAEAIKKLIEDTKKHVWEGIHSGDATEHLEWLSKQDADTIRKAIIATQPRGWNLLTPTLVDSLNQEQLAGVLAAMVAVFVQAEAQRKAG